MNKPTRQCWPGIAYTARTETVLLLLQDYSTTNHRNRTIFATIHQTLTLHSPKPLPPSPPQQVPPSSARSPASPGATPTAPSPPHPRPSSTSLATPPPSARPTAPRREPPCTPASCSYSCHSPYETQYPAVPSASTLRLPLAPDSPHAAVHLQNQIQTQIQQPHPPTHRP